MDKSLPRITVIVPVYNHAQYLGAALESILAQSLPAHEIIVVDDGSQDGSAEVAKKYPQVRLLVQTNGGIAAARNAGLKLASGEFIAFLDADDLWHADKLKLQVEAIAADPELQMVFGMTHQFFSPELSEAERALRKIDQTVLPGRFAGTLLMSRQSFERVGGFREDLRSAEFLDWYGRAQALGLKEELLPQVLYERRVHSTNHGIRERSSRGDYFRALKDSVDRRRKTGTAGS